MKVQRFEIEGLAQYSYVVSDGGEAAVIDAIRDIDRYIMYTEASNVKITHILETHIHADFAAGSTALARATGGKLALSAYDEGERYRYAMHHRALRDGDGVQVGSARLQALHTPGHTPEHLSFLLFDDTRSESEPLAMFSGDFLLVGSLGRPDLLGDEAKVGLARDLYRSVRERIATLPDGVEVYPGHGAGSLCGSGMSDRAETTLGYERATNPFFQYGEEEFVEKILGSVPAMPDYYPRMKGLNAAGAPVLHELPGDLAIAADELGSLMDRGEVVLLDLRSPEAFGGAHIAGAINIGSGPSLSLWAGWLIAPECKIVLITHGDDDEEARRGLVRVGLDGIVGRLRGGMGAWVTAGLPFARTAQATLQEVEQARGRAMVLDVRTDEEREGGSIPGSRHVMLGDLPDAMGELPKDVPVVTVCGTGYRSSIAASLLQRAGFADVSTMHGGMDAWMLNGMPLGR